VLVEHNGDNHKIDSNLAKEQVKFLNARVEIQFDPNDPNDPNGRNQTVNELCHGEYCKIPCPLSGIRGNILRWRE
jgi:hypothetical protein